MKPGRLPRQHGARLARRRGRGPRRARAAGASPGSRVDLVSPSPAAGRHPLLAFPNVIITTHIGGATYETLRHGGEMAAAEIERFLARRAAAQRRGPRRARRRRGRAAGADEPHARDRSRDRQLPGGHLRRGRARRSRSASASGRTPALPGAPGSQVFDTARNWTLICDCIREALDRGGHRRRPTIAAVSSTSMREGMVLYDADGREIWACPNVDSRAAAEAAELVASGDARRLFEQGGDWVSITSPARFLLDPGARARDVRAGSPTSGCSATGSSTG